MSNTECDTSDEELPLPPCRVAEGYVVECPLCKRRVKLKTLRYTHICRRSFDPMARALEQNAVAAAALKHRMAQLERMKQQIVKR